MHHSYRLLVAYDGTDFHGWQEQANNITVTSELKKAFKSVFFKPCSIVGASRTDSGVHANGQVARLDTELLIDPHKLATAWNFRLARGIMIKDAERTTLDFNPRKNVREKTYSYRLFTQFPTPFEGRWGWLYPFIDVVDFKTFESVLQLYLGTHDFTSFCKYQESISPVKTIASITLAKEDFLTPSFLVTIKGPSFAQYQIRRMIGYALDVSRRPKTAHDRIKELLLNPCAEQTLAKAGASGLTLQKIEYHATHKE